MHDRRDTAALGVLARGDALELGLSDVGQLHHVPIDHADAAARNGPHRELFVPRYAQLSHDEYVEWRAERHRDLEADGNAAARQREHDEVWPLGVCGQHAREPSSRIEAILVRNRIHLPGSSLVGLPACCCLAFAACFSTPVRSPPCMSMVGSPPGPAVRTPSTWPSCMYSSDPPESL